MSELLLIRRTLEEAADSACFTCSFQAEDIVLLHLLRQVQPDIPILFLETGYHIPALLQYRDENHIPYASLYDQGFMSIGCEPCTIHPPDPSNARSGRWGGMKLECGIHTFAERS